MSSIRDDFISQYLSYIGETEVPVFYHRWCCLSMIGAYLGRQYSFNLGHFELYPNMYIMLLGDPGTRKSTALKIAKKLLRAAGYDKISADRSTKEKFLLDLAGVGRNSEADILESNLFGGTSEPSEMYIACDEFNDFIGINNVEFISLLGNFWDYTGPPYENRIKNGQSVSIPDPTISILGGNTPTSFAKAFPPDLQGQGFFSRLLLIHGANTGKRITFPVPPPDEDTAVMVAALQKIKSSVTGKAIIADEARNLLDKIYQTFGGLPDVRFASYSTRRFTHLLKLCLVVSASRCDTTITAEDVIYSNTILHHTEQYMAKAMGEFGKGRYSDVSHKVIQVLSNSVLPIPMMDLYKMLSQEVDNIGTMSEIARNLMESGKIITAAGSGFLVKSKEVEEVYSDILDYGYLTKEEKEMKA